MSDEQWPAGLAGWGITCDKHERQCWHREAPTEQQGVFFSRCPVDTNYVAQFFSVTFPALKPGEVLLNPEYKEPSP